MACFSQLDISRRGAGAEGPLAQSCASSSTYSAALAEHSWGSIVSQLVQWIWADSFSAALAPVASNICFGSIFTEI